MAETELHKVPGWSADHVARLAKSWINSAEQVVAVSATNGGLQSLAQQLGVSEEETRRLVDLARAALSPEVRATMGQKFDSDDRGMGARPPGKEDGNKPPGTT
jgi:hypothetical protein